MALKDWKKDFVFKGKFNEKGGTQSHTKYVNMKARYFLEKGHDRPHYSKDGWYFVSIRNLDWDTGRWDTKEFDSKKEMEKYAIDYMKTH
jgi:hypothetical protein